MGGSIVELGILSGCVTGDVKSVLISKDDSHIISGIWDVVIESECNIGTSSRHTGGEIFGEALNVTDIDGSYTLFNDSESAVGSEQDSEQDSESEYGSE